MRNTHLAWSWELWVVVLICLVLASTTALFADQDSQQGIQLKATGVSFQKLMAQLASENGMKLVIQTDDDFIVNADFSSSTPVETMMMRVAKDVGLDFWKTGDTYYIGKQKTISVKPTPTIDPAPALPNPLVPDPVKPSLLTSVGATNMPKADTPATPPVIRSIPLQYMSVRELLYMLGIPSGSIENSRRQVLDNRIEKVYDVRHPQDITQNTLDNGLSYNGNSAAASSPWLSGVLGQVSPHDASSTDAYQFPGMPGGGMGGAPIFPGGGGGAPGAAAPTPGGGATATGGTAGRPGAAGGAGGGGGLKTFVPDGIKQMIGLIGLNAILVKADKEDDIDQLQALIKLLDQPVKQVVVEVMFVDMNIQDAMSMSASLEYSGMPVSFISNNGGTAGNMLLSYVKGDVQANLAAILTKSWNKVVNAPRVVAQNGQGASVEFTTNIPFITIDSEEDVFGRELTVPNISMQQFMQGLTVNRVDIHPDNSVTLDVTPEINSPASTGVPVPGGGSGSVFGSNSISISAVVRVKDGETIMMGGFITKNETRQSTETPLLGKIPLIGPLLFGSHGSTSNNEETMIFITPTIMKEDTTDFTGLQALPPLF